MYCGETFLVEKLLLRLPGKGNSNFHGARPVHLIITMIQWIRASRLSLNSLSQVYCGETHLVEKLLRDRTVMTRRSPRSRPDGRQEHFISCDARHDRCIAGRRTLWRSSLFLSLSLSVFISLSLSPSLSAALALYLVLAHALSLP